jgi:hypothetical protein
MATPNTTVDTLSEYYQVEADFGKGRGWQRNHQKHPSFEFADGMRIAFQKIAKTRIIKIVETHVESIVFEDCT